MNNIERHIEKIVELSAVRASEIVLQQLMPHLETMYRDTVMSIAQTFKVYGDNMIDLDRLTEDLQALYRRFTKNLKMISERILQDRSVKNLIDDFFNDMDRVFKQLYIDPLTGLLNERCRSDFFTRQSNTGKYIGISIDIDDFKKINDSKGHDYGDEVLKKVAEIISHTIEKLGRDRCHAFRLGGEEFGILIKVRADSDAETEYGFIGSIAELIRKKVEDTGQCTVSIGVSEMFDLPITLEEYQQKRFAFFGDNNLYMAKQKGKNRIVYPEDVQHDKGVSNEQ